MTKANKEVLRAYRRLNREFDKANSYSDWMKRRAKVLMESPITVTTWKRLVESIFM